MQCGHPLFGIFGYTPMVLGGTLAELLCQCFARAISFGARDRRDCFLRILVFENFPYIERTWLMHERKTCRCRRANMTGGLIWAMGIAGAGSENRRSDASDGMDWDAAVMGWLAWRTYLSAQAEETARVAVFDTAFPAGTQGGVLRQRPLNSSQPTQNAICSTSISATLHESVLIFADCTITSRSFPLPKRPVGPSDEYNGSYQLARWVSTEKRLCIELSANSSGRSPA